MIDYQKYNAAQLQKLIGSEQFRKFKHVPISTIRAQSQLVNPRLNKDINLLYVAYLNDEVVGYQLVFCDTIYIDNKPELMGWLSCIWVDGGQRGMGIGKTLFELTIADWGDRLLFADPVPASQMLYCSKGLFADAIKLQGTRLYMRWNMAYLLPNKKTALGAVKPLLKLSDGLLNVVQDTRREHFEKALQITYNVVPEVNDRTSEFINSFQREELFRRGQADLNWVVNKPWLHSGEETEEDKKYYFSSYARQLKVQHIVIHQPGERDAVIAYLMLFVRDGHMKLPYVYFKAEHTELVAKVVMKLILENKVDMFTTFHPQLSKYFAANRKPAIFAKAIERSYFVAKPFAPHFRTGDGRNFADGDGDQAFT